MALNKRDEAKVDTYDFHAPQPAHLFDPRAIGVITIFQYGRNTAALISSASAPRFASSGPTDEAVKVAKKTVKALNAGTLDVDSNLRLMASYEEIATLASDINTKLRHQAPT
jgi:hypothetical protein